MEGQVFFWKGWGWVGQFPKTKIPAEKTLRGKNHARGAIGEKSSKCRQKGPLIVMTEGEGQAKVKSLILRPLKL